MLGSIAAALNQAASWYQESYFPTVIRPVQQRLPLTWTAEGIAGLTVLLDLIDVTPESLPALDLATVFFRHSPAHVVAAIQPFLRHSDSGRLASIPKWFREQSRPFGDDFAFLNQLTGNSLRQSVMYLPQNTPSASISLGVSSGLNSGSKFRPWAQSIDSDIASASGH